MPASALFPYLSTQAKREEGPRRIGRYSSRALLTYRLPLISYTRNIANRKGRASGAYTIASQRNCICIRGRLSRSTCKGPRSSLVAASRPLSPSPRNEWSKSSRHYRPAANDEKGAWTERNGHPASSKMVPLNFNSGYFSSNAASLRAAG